jgi:hypothetical protein
MPLWFFVLCELDETKRIILGKTFRNTESVKSFIAAIADVEFLKVAKLITDSKFICIIPHEISVLL